jgi:hypothetical protein
MTDAINPWFRAYDSARALWRDPSTHNLPWSNWQHAFTWTPADDLPPAPGRTVCRASTTLEAGQFPPPAGFVLAEAWSDPPYRLVWISTSDRMILTFTEGDLSHVACDNDETWQQTCAEHGAYYRDLMT